MEPNKPNDQPSNKRGPTNGTWVAVVLIVGGLIIAIVSGKYRRPPPPDETQPTTEMSVP